MNNSRIMLLLGSALCLTACGNEGVPPAPEVTDAPRIEEETAAPQLTGTYQDLLEIHAALQAFKPFSPVDGVTDYSAPVISGRRGEISAMQDRLQGIDVRGWSVPQEVDYLTVRAELDEQEFILRVTRPWARDPTFYLSALLRMAFTELPAEGETLARLQQNLRAVPPLLEQARGNLTDVAADNAALAIRSLTLSDGVENGFPYRESPPPGVIGWYEDLLARAEGQPELMSDVTAALDALRGFHDWLVEHRASMDGLNGVGKEKLDWFVRNALLIPYTSDEMMVLAQREYDRLRAFNALERHRNRGLPEIALPTSREEYQQRLAGYRQVDPRLADRAGGHFHSRLHPDRLARDGLQRAVDRPIDRPELLGADSVSKSCTRPSARSDSRASLRCDGLDARRSSDPQQSQLRCAQGRLGRVPGGGDDAGRRPG